jgi:hypothetical protein
MTKNLFLRFFNEYSRWDYSYFYSKFVQRLPCRFLEGALIANPSLQSCAGYAELHALFLSESGLPWKNPELYPFLNYLMIPEFPSLQASVDALRVHVGLIDLAGEVTHVRHIWRLRNPVVQTLEIVDGHIRSLQDLCQRASKGEQCPLVYKPYPSLFSDLHENYKGHDYEGEVGPLVDLTCKAIALLSRYSPEIGDSFSQEIGTVAYMPTGASIAKSFSLRNYYIGGIFVSISDAISVAEQFLHEYYHQRIWPWWMVESPADLPGNNVTLVSPMTGRVRPASVMIQALLIYSSLLDYYNFVLSATEISEFGEESLGLAQNRLRQIRQGIPPLVEALRQALVGYPASLGVVEFLVSSTVKLDV